MQSCNKTDNTTDLQDVKFNASASTLGLKASSCDNPAANFALIEIDGDVYQTDVFYLNEKIYTTTFKLAPGNHTISMFVLINDGGTPNNPDGDVIVFVGAPSLSAISSRVALAPCTMTIFSPR